MGFAQVQTAQRLAIPNGLEKTSIESIPPHFDDLNVTISHFPLASRLVFTSHDLNVLRSQATGVVIESKPRSRERSKPEKERIPSRNKDATRGSWPYY